MHPAVPSPFAHWFFAGSWRRYQELALEAFERNLEGGEPRTLIVAPPGSGKTLLGLEIVRRLGRPALVLCPSQTIRRQWEQKERLFSSSSDEHLHAMTYQAICQADDPEDLLRLLAQREWARGQAVATGLTIEEVAAAERTEAAAALRTREISTIVARLKRQAATGALESVEASDLLSARARELIDELRVAGVSIVVFDECHHLCSMWGSLLMVILEELQPQHVVGLTATSPTDLTADEAALYHRLLGDVHFSVPTPAVVREGHLAPFQELVQICAPLPSEREWLAARHERFAELLGRLDDPPVELGLSAWLLARLGERRTPAGAQLSWPQFAGRQPRFADAGLRWLHQAGKPIPPGAPHREAQRAELNLDDWAALLSDYALGCLLGSGTDEADRRFKALKLALGDLGYIVTRKGIRRTGTDVDRVLLNSAAKPLAMCDVLAIEFYEGRGDKLRAIVLCDSIHGPRQANGSPLALSGGGRGILRAAVRDDRLGILRPALVTGDLFAISAESQSWWLDRLSALADRDGVDLPRAGFMVVEDEGIAVVSHGSGRFTSARWVDWATELLASGDVKLLVGTRGLLGEGWDCPQVNVLIDLTEVAADVSVRQMRGRSLRLDPSQPQKLASNWDIVCVAPDVGRGRADYDRFVRRHLHIYAPCEDGTIESGPSHVYPSLSRYGPPETEEFEAINIEQRRRALDLEGARDRWKIGEAYRAVELSTVAVRRRRTRSAGVAAGSRQFDDLRLDRPPRPRSELRHPLLTGLLTYVRGRRAELYPLELPLEWAVGSIADAYVALGELTEAAVASIVFAPRPDGWLRISMPSATPAESQKLSKAVEELLDESIIPRYVVSRRAVIEESKRAKLETSWYPVPSDLARNSGRAETFYEAWTEWCGNGELVYAQGEARKYGTTFDLASTAWLTVSRRTWC